MDKETFDKAADFLRKHVTGTIAQLGMLPATFVLVTTESMHFVPIEDEDYDSKKGRLEQSFRLGVKSTGEPFDAVFLLSEATIVNNADPDDHFEAAVVTGRDVTANLRVSSIARMDQFKFDEKGAEGHFRDNDSFHPEELDLFVSGAIGGGSLN